MQKIVKHSLFSRVIVPIALFISLVTYYVPYSQKIPISYWDEMLWVGRSYFIVPYIQGNFHSSLWRTYRSYDQPKLTEYAFGLWLYPIYVRQMEASAQSFEYAHFLIRNGFNEVIDEAAGNIRIAYLNSQKSSRVPQINEGEKGSSSEYIAKYGLGALKPIALIHHSRILNVILLSGAITVAYFMVLQFMGFIPAILFSIFYGFNTLIITTGIMAHSEALFLFTFNAAFLFMCLYFSRRKVSYLLAFSLFAGLCMSTKLNGIAVAVFFLIFNSMVFIFNQKKTLHHFIAGFFPLFISLVIFIWLNPFTYPDPIKNTLYMFDSRMKTALLQSNDSSNQSLSSPQMRMRAVFQNFYIEAPQYNSLIFFNISYKNQYYAPCLFILFVFGFLHSLFLAFRKNIFHILFVSSFIFQLMAMSYYLIINWDRYFVLLPVFFILFQLNGLYLMLKHALYFIRAAVFTQNIKIFLY